jgi:glutathione S-transferase
MSSLKLYGVPLSQPFRAVAWVLLQKHVPFTVKITVPGATSKIGSRHEAFLSLTEHRTNVVPVLQLEEENVNSLSLFESPAILTHLCERYQWQTLLPPPATPAKALVDSYLHWHHSGTRTLISLTKPLLRPELGVVGISDKDLEEAHSTLSRLESGWLGPQRIYLAGTDEPTIADILAYEEILQTHYLAPQNVVDIKSTYPNLWDWMQRMQTLPYHEQVHRALDVLTSSENSALDINKRLGAATKAGLLALTEAQATFPSSPNLSKL